LSTSIASDTVLPFSTSAGTSIVTLPFLTGASPTTLRIAACIDSGVACAGATITAAAPAASPPISTSRRVVALMSLAIAISGPGLVLVPQRGQERDHVLDLLRAQYRLAAERLRHPVHALDHIIGRHDGVRVQLPGIDQPQPQLAFRPTRTRPLEVRRHISLEPLRRKRAGMTQQAKPDLAVEHDRASARRAALLAGERGRNGAAHDRIGAQRLLRRGDPGRQHDGGPDHGAEPHPHTSAVMVLNQVSAAAASCWRNACGASTGLIETPPLASLNWSLTGR